MAFYSDSRMCFKDLMSQEQVAATTECKKGQDGVIRME